ncbi:hypothetical protein C8F04DRAFT_1261761 [Mycena alexandri]|uniref:Uncharacterized protein n=1 Tax=Mycena alexandri TaxID=1745969 RepID=A0AAD6STA8_9AGAR|nr:hypothetical protein C8F04DRAFT_1261761 [Mycena alexandri]
MSWKAMAVREHEGGRRRRLRAGGAGVVHAPGGEAFLECTCARATGNAHLCDDVESGILVVSEAAVRDTGVLSTRTRLEGGLEAGWHLAAVHEGDAAFRERLWCFLDVPATLLSSFPSLLLLSLRRRLMLTAFSFLPVMRTGADDTDSEGGDYLFAPPVAETVFAYPGTPAASSFNSTSRFSFLSPLHPFVFVHMASPRSPPPSTRFWFPSRMYSLCLPYRRISPHLHTPSLLSPLSSLSSLPPILRFHTLPLGHAPFPPFPLPRSPPHGHALPSSYLLRSPNPPASPFAMPMSAPTMSPDAMLRAYATKKKHTSSSTKHTSGAEVVPTLKNTGMRVLYKQPEDEVAGSASASSSESGEVLGGAAPLIRAGPGARLTIALLRCIYFARTFDDDWLSTHPPTGSSTFGFWLPDPDCTTCTLPRTAVVCYSPYPPTGRSLVSSLTHTHPPLAPCSRFDPTWRVPLATSPTYVRIFRIVS